MDGNSCGVVFLTIERIMFLPMEVKFLSRFSGRVLINKNSNSVTEYLTIIRRTKMNVSGHVT